MHVLKKTLLAAGTFSEGAHTIGCTLLMRAALFGHTELIQMSESCRRNFDINLRRLLETLIFPVDWLIGCVQKELLFV